MKKPKEKTYWVVKDADGDLDSGHLCDTRKEAHFSTIVRTGMTPDNWEECQAEGWKIVKVKLVECK